MSTQPLPAGWGYLPGLRIGADGAPRDESKVRAQHNRIAYWLGALGRVPSVEEIRNQWGVSRPTAYRWRAFARSGGETIVHPLHKRNPV